MRALVIGVVALIALPAIAEAQSSQRARYEEARRISIELKRLADERCRQTQRRAKNERGNPWNLYNQLEACNPYENQALPPWEDCEPACPVVTLGMLKAGYAELEVARRRSRR